MGVVFPEGITVVPLNSLMKTLPSGAPSVLGTLTGSPHCRMNALVSAWASFALPYILGTVIDQTITVVFVDELLVFCPSRLVFYYGSFPFYFPSSITLLSRRQYTLGLCTFTSGILQRYYQIDPTSRHLLYLARLVPCSVTPCLCTIFLIAVFSYTKDDRSIADSLGTDMDASGPRKFP